MSDDSASGSRQPNSTDEPLTRSPLFFGSIVALLLGGILILFAIYGARATARRTACMQNLKQIGIALHAYHDLHGSFPPAYIAEADGRPLHSWRVLLLPQLGEEQLYRQYRFDEPWDGPHNRDLIPRMPTVYGCPGQAGASDGVTNYVAVVGRQTIWPEQYAARIQDVEDGTSNTVQVIEWPGSDIAWTEPRDVRYRDTEKTLAPPAHRGSEAGVQHVLLADTAVRAISTQVDRTTYRRLQTRSSGRPLPGVKWPLEPSVREFDFGEIVPAGQLVETDVLASRDMTIAAGRNAVWCATIQIAWDELRALVGEPVRLADDPPLTAALNRRTFDRKSLDPNCYVARGGRMSEGILDRITRELEEQFPNSTPSLLMPAPSDDAVVLYCYLLKILPFAVHFERLDGPLSFHGQGTTTSVTAFGVSEAPHDGFDQVELRKQVSILDYAGPDDFVLQLDTLDRRDVIVLAKVTPQGTLAETVAAVQQRIADARLTPAQRTFAPKETLAAPVLSLNVERQFDEIIGKSFLNAAASGLHIARASQVIRFRLDERGAYLESEAEIIGENGHAEPPPPPQPRQFIFDRPFLLLLQERGASEPYFAAWIGSAELMESR